jgi:DNA-binding NtrC family response regulator
MAPPKNTKSILLLSTDQALITAIADNLTLNGYRLLRAASQSEALSLLDRESVDVALLDIEQVARQEIDIVNYVKTKLPHSEVIVLAGVKDLEDARNALRNGASFYLIKPVVFTDIKLLLDQISLRAEQNQEHMELEQQALFDLMAGSQSMEKVLKLAMKIAPTASTVLLGGESGTGKEFFARIIHRMSNRPSGRFVPMNCGAVPDTLFESEMFGHRKGSFTGADRDRPGLVEEAHLGTLFLDEVGELTPSAQVKLLRFLQERTFRRIGDNLLRTANVRIIAASNKDLFGAVKEGKFREDLFYRLNVFYLLLPPLRERRETIPTLVKLFVHRYNQAFGKHINNISAGAEALLAGYDYPGNVRELENIIEHAIVLADENKITEKDLPELMFRNKLMLEAPTATQDPDVVLSLEDVEKRHIEFALQRLDYNYTEAAKRLGVSRSTLWRKIKTYKLSVPKSAEAEVSTVDASP